MNLLRTIYYIHRCVTRFIVLICLINIFCYCLNRTKRTIHHYKRPEKLEAISNWMSPQEGTIDRTRFYLYTRRNPDRAQELTINNEQLLFQSSFDHRLPIKFVISGWLDNRYFAKWVRIGVNSLLVHGDYNVIYVAWKSIKELFVAAIVIKLFSADLAQFIIFLKNTCGINGELIHCIGHSLGSFLCGFAGDLTYIGRISVLDAGPRPWYQSMPEDQRLNRWQAGFVDVIHSDVNPVFSLGLTIPLGDIDFYPNWGTPQPSCMRDKVTRGFMELKDEGLIVGVFQWIRYLLFCSHYRSHEWFFESVANHDCAFVAVRCHSYDMFMSGECGCDTSPHSCALMGMNADTILTRGLDKYSQQGKWFIKTSDNLQQSETHCLFQYQLVIQLGQFFPKSNGSVIITIHSDSGNTQEEVSSISGQLVPGMKFGKLAVRQRMMFNIHGLSVSWKLSESLDPISYLNWINIVHIKLAPIQISHNNKPLQQFFCSNGLQIGLFQSISLVKC